MQIYTQATMMWLATHSAEFIVSSKQQIKQDPHAFWPEEEGEPIGGSWASYPGNREVCFEGDQEEVYVGTEDLPHIEVVVTETGPELRAPDEIDEALRSQILAACKPWIEEAGSQLTTISSAFAMGLGVAEVRTMDHDIELSIEVEAEEPINPARDCKLVLMSVSSSELSFQHMLGIVLRGTFHTWEVVEGEGGSGFTTDYYDENGRCYMSFSTYGQGSDIEVY